MKRYIAELKEAVGSMADLPGEAATSIDDLGEEGSRWLGLFVVTGGTEHVILEAVRRFSVPLIIAHERLNSLAASLEALARLKEEGYRTRLLIKENRDFRHVLTIYATVFKALSALRSGVLLLGSPSDWLVASVPPRQVLRRAGIKLSFAGLNELYDRYSRVKEEDVDTVLERFRGIEVVEPSESGLRDAARLYIAIRTLLEDYDARLTSIRCFDVIARLGTTACLALALLNSEGYVAGCEGDVVSLIGMTLALHASGMPGFMGNIAVLGEGEIILAHCTIPLALLSRYKLRTHFESGMGVGVEGVLRPDVKTITLFRLSRKLDKAHVVLAEVIRSGGWSRHQCRTQVLLKTPLEFTLELTERPLGNHYVMIVGNRVEEARSFAELLGAEALVWT